MRSHAVMFGALTAALAFAGCLQLPPMEPMPDGDPVEGSLDDGLELGTMPDAMPDATPDATPDADPCPAEVCNGQDDDCDGATDEEAGCCDEGTFQPCGVEEGVCTVGEQRCVDGEWAPCPGLAEAGPETCDLRDEDCDGQVDENLDGGEACYTGPPETRAIGRCVAGQSACVDGAGGCVGQYLPRPTDPCGFGDEDCDGEIDEDCVTCPDDIVAPPGWVCIPPGTFTMGVDDARDAHGSWTTPSHPVEITYPFFMAVGEMSKAAYAAALDIEPVEQGLCASGDRCPVRLDWVEAVVVANHLSARDGLECCFEMVRCGEVDPVPCGEEQADDFEGCAQVRMPRRLACEGYRLPSEAEWEYAAAAGTATRYWTGDDPVGLGVGDHLEDPAWHVEYARQVLRAWDSGPTHHWGLRNVLGNVGEHVLDMPAEYAPAPGGEPLVDPLVWSDGLDVDPIERGGNWREAPDRLTTRGRGMPSPFGEDTHRRRGPTRTGLRLVRRVPGF